MAQPSEAVATPYGASPLIVPNKPPERSRVGVVAVSKIERHVALPKLPLDKRVVAPRGATAADPHVGLAELGWLCLEREFHGMALRPPIGRVDLAQAQTSSCHGTCVEAQVGLKIGC